tara:strand:- start:164 stop:457 length:294 start_codon:yes stop_codon:yes gene_type:complete
MVIGITTVIEIKKEAKYQILNLIHYNPPYNHEKKKCPWEKDKLHMDTFKLRKYQKLKTFKMCGTSLVSISNSFLLFILLLIFSHSLAHAGHELADLL